MSNYVLTYFCDFISVYECSNLYMLANFVLLCAF
jgi:hypothetical protein